MNQRIVKVDFKVKESKTYSFFIEEELCEVSLEKTPNGFLYGFQRDMEVDTPLNRERKKENRLNARKLAIFFGCFVAAIALGVFLLRVMEKKQRAKASFFTPLSSDYEKLLSEKGKLTVAKIAVQESTNHKIISYTFVADKEQPFTKTFQMPDSAVIILPNGFPLSNNDEFNATYLPNSPEVHRIDFSNPTEKQIGLYTAQAAVIDNRYNPKNSMKKSLCMAQQVVAKAGWEKLADLIFQYKNPAENSDHNSDTYSRLMHEPSVKMAMDENCWDK